jgi:hypothetical protein
VLSRDGELTALQLEYLEQKEPVAGSQEPETKQ